MGTYPETDNGKRPIFLTYDDILYRNFTFPEVLNGKCTGIVAITKISESLEDIAR